VQQVVEEISQNSSEESKHLQYKIYPESILTSELINTRKIVELLKNPDQQQHALEKELEEIEKAISQPLTDSQKEKLSNFIQIRKEMEKNEDDKNAEDEALKLEEQLLAEK